MEHDSIKRGYLLPGGCKDLIDTLKHQPLHEPKHPSLPRPVPAPLPPIVGELVIPEQTSVSDLAKLLGQKPFAIVADLLRLGIFANVTQTLDFQIISRVARKHGFIAKRAV